MLYYDAEGKPLEGELAGVAGRAAGGSEAVLGETPGWKVFQCFDER